MVKTASTMLPLGTAAPDFELPNVDGKVINRSDFAGKPLLVIFMCNHCPFVKHLADHLAVKCKEWQESGIAVVGISSNDADEYPDDSPAAMKQESANRAFSFDYLYDETQAIAKAYHAACTPDFFLFDSNHQLVYRGQYDSSRPGNDEEVTGQDLDAAVKKTVAGEAVPEPQVPSIGCNIKWKAGSAPGYFDPQGTA